MRKFYFRSITALAVALSLWTGTMAQSKAFDTSRMDTSADACQDFFQYANGTWIKNTQIPPEYSRWGTFNLLADNNQTILKNILEKAAANKSAAPGSDEQLIGDLYSSCMNEAEVEKADAKPLKKYFKRIDKIKDKNDLPAAVAEFHRAGIPMFFGFGAGADAKNSNMNIANASQGGLSLPNRDYYTIDNDKMKAIREKFIQYATDMFVLLGDAPDTAAANANKVMALQNRLANASKRPDELRNPDARYNIKTLPEAAQLTPDFSWDSYLKSRSVPTVASFNVGQPDFFKGLDEVLKEASLDDLKTYMRFMVVNTAAPRLSKRFVDKNFDFYSRTLSGTKEQQPRWKRCVSVVDNTLGEALGMAYIKDNFKADTKQRANEMIDQIFKAFAQRLDKLDWMSEETKVQARRKLAAFKRKIGYPDKLRGYVGLKINRKSFFENTSNASVFLINRNLQDVGQSVDKTRWGFTTPTINASYNSSYNDITIPAGILQPPFFSFTADDAINYGGIGGVIGHELSHGFDDSGSRFDADGNLKMWWTPEDRQKFDERAMCVVKQFNGYEVQPGVTINGKLTLGENIGDLGGLNVSYTAFENSLAGKPRPADIDGFTPEQRFFLGWAQVWATKSTPEFERQQVLTDPHSNARYRVNGPISNMPEFAKAFGCKQGDRMVKSDMCRIW